MENLAEHRLVGYSCIAAVKKISNFSACEREQKVIYHKADLIWYPKTVCLAC